MLNWLKSHWFRVLTLGMFLACVGGLAWALVLQHAGFVVTMVALGGILAVMVFTDYKRLTSKK